MRRVDNSMHRKSRRLLKNIVILSIENPQSHTDNAKNAECRNETSPFVVDVEWCWYLHSTTIVRQIARLPEQRCWQKRRNVGKLPSTPAAEQNIDFQ
jgi:hypothetical protein